MSTHGIKTVAADESRIKSTMADSAIGSAINVFSSLLPNSLTLHDCVSVQLIGDVDREQSHGPPQCRHTFSTKFHAQCRFWNTRRNANANRSPQLRNPCRDIFHQTHPPICGNRENDVPRWRRRQRSYGAISSHRRFDNRIDNPNIFPLYVMGLSLRLSALASERVRLAYG